MVMIGLVVVVVVVVMMMNVRRRMVRRNRSHEGGWEDVTHGKARFWLTTTTTIVHIVERIIGKVMIVVGEEPNVVENLFDFEVVTVKLGRGSRFMTTVLVRRSRMRIIVIVVLVVVVVGDHGHGDDAEEENK